jgi:3-ketosteroid 9alpha-monooxygenase subunit B
MANVRKYLSEVTRIREPVTGTFVVSLRSEERPFRYSPGQFLHLALDPYDPSFPWPPSRCFSIQSCEQESEITVTFSVKGAFTARMALELTPGKQVWLKLPYGDLFSDFSAVIHPVFIAGGTGVTPFLSLFNSPLFEKSVNPTLYLGVRSADFQIYEDALAQATRINPSFQRHVVAQDTDGLLQITDIFAAHGTGATWYISGPPAMIHGFTTVLLAHGVPPEKIRTDDWE